MVIQSQLHFLIDEYLALEEQAVGRSEYDNGQIVSIEESTLNHSLIGGNVLVLLHNYTRKQDCTVVGSNVKVLIEKANAFVYPDAMLICGAVEEAEKTNHALTNPTLIVEVLSKSTEGYDRGGKFHKYCTLPSFKEYILIDQYKPVIDILYRADATHWELRTVMGMDKELYVRTLDVHFPLADIYENTKDLEATSFHSQ
ncbi:MAG: Uma2 family endonuclease [Bacteroidota bacterium]